MVPLMRGFYEIAAADPGRTAVVESTTGRTEHTESTENTAAAGLPEPGRMTYGELHERVNRVSNGLIARGVTPGEAVVTVLPNGVDAITMMLATYQIGAYHVPVNWHYTAEEIGYIVTDCAARAVIGCERYADAVPGGFEEVGAVAEGSPPLRPPSAGPGP
nr:hypothetical protein GCM10020093_094260 [Planobispora longispora]